MKSKQSKNQFKKKRDSEGKELAEEIGKGINEEQERKAIEGRENNESVTFRLPKQQKEGLLDLCENPSELLRAFVRGYVSQRKLIN